VLTPSLARVRHWSCPDRLPSDTLAEHFDQELIAVDDSLKSTKHGATQRCLAQWEEKVLRLRSARNKRKRHFAPPSSSDDLHTFFHLQNSPTLGHDLALDLEEADDDVFVEVGSPYLRLSEESEPCLHLTEESESEPCLRLKEDPYQNPLSNGAGGLSISRQILPHYFKNPSINCPPVNPCREDDDSTNERSRLMRSSDASNLSENIETLIAHNESNQNNNKTFFVVDETNRMCQSVSGVGAETLSDNQNRSELDPSEWQRSPDLNHMVSLSDSNCVVSESSSFPSDVVPTCPSDGISSVSRCPSCGVCTGDFCTVASCPRQGIYTNFRTSCSSTTSTSVNNQLDASLQNGVSQAQEAKLAEPVVSVSAVTACSSRVSSVDECSSHHFVSSEGLCSVESCPIHSLSAVETSGGVSVQKQWLSLVTLCSYIISFSWMFSRRTNSHKQYKHPKARPIRKLDPGLGFCVLLPLLFLVPTQAAIRTKDPVCVGNINIKDNLEDFLNWQHCKVLEGSLMINMFNIDFIKHNQSQMQNVSLPELTEITDFLLLYRADQIIDLSNILPKLAVIRGNKLTNSYALVIYRMKFMTSISLPSLTHIVKGGVKIEKNPNLCYVDTINWKKIVHKDWHDYISIEENSDEERCPQACPDDCPASSSNEGEKCWNAKTCQKLIVTCPEGTDAVGQQRCYSDGGSEIAKPCDEQCIGGCTGLTREDCISCKNLKLNYQQPGDKFGCHVKCPKEFLSYKNWTCISEDHCMSKSTCSEPLKENADLPYNILRSVQGDQCVEECPGQYTSKKKRKNGRWIYECEECSDCPKICNGENIKSHENAEAFNGCTIIDGDLEIKISKSNIMASLEENLGKIKEIRGALKITRSKSLVSLHFFKSLQRIKGKDKYSGLAKPYAIEILENENLQKLFEEKKNITITGKAFIHYNPQLCRKEITKLVSRSGIKTGYEYHKLDISDTTNGDKAVCSEQELYIYDQHLPSFGGTAILIIHFENFEKSLASKSNQDVRSLLGYNIYYREITEEQFAHKNLTKYEGREACGGETWEIINQRKKPVEINLNSTAHKDSLAFGSCEDGDQNCLEDAKNSLLYGEETSFISQLKPYTAYAIYVSTLMTKPFSGQDATGAQSKIIYVRTLVGIPEPVRKLVVTPTSSSSGLEVSWEPPKKPNGILDHYDVIVEFNPLQDGLINVNWCDKKKPIKIIPKIPKSQNLKSNTTDLCPKQQCPTCKNGEANVLPVEEEDHINDAYLEDAIINTIFNQKVPDGSCPSKRLKRSAKQNDEPKDNTIIQSSKDDLDTAENNLLIQVRSANDEMEYMLAKNESRTTGITGEIYFTKMYAQVGGNVTHPKITIEQLKHYGQYSVKVRACHVVQKINPDCKDPPCKMTKRCSIEEEVVKKTQAKPKADDIVNPHSGEVAQLLIAVGSKVSNGELEDEDNDHSESSTGGETYIRWFPPQAPNEMITMYKLRMKKDLADESEEHVNCISFNDPKITPWEERAGWVQYKLTWAGSYYISLKAVSLYGEGAWTSYQWAQVQTDNDYVLYIVLVVILLILLMSFGLGVGMVYKKRRAETDGPLIVSVNPEYIPTSEVYVVDEWEVAREIIDQQEELGKGSFGMVYKGCYHHPNKGDLDVAIKTVNDQATLRQRIEFLNEASVMKDFDTEHVVKLIGVVSQGQPTLVLMELMDVGDLKNYLRTLRPNSDENQQREREGKEKIPPPTVKLIEKMALDIADGMSYLSVKKCIHRDLAARNCMVNNSINVKVGDFGMARDVYETEYYRKEGKGLLPVRWMAPESLRDGIFTSQSDVWSYGVVLWEMSTLAEQPYQGLANDQVVFYVKEGNVMEKPENCPEKLHGLMSDCWQRNSSQRPTFLEICDRLLEGQDDAFVDAFRAKSFYHSAAGREAMANETNLKAARREADELASNNPETPLTTTSSHTTLNHVNNKDNGHLPGEEHPLVPLNNTVTTWKAEQFVRANIENEKPDSRGRVGSRSPGSNGPSQLASGEGSNGPSYMASNESSRSSKLSMNAVNGLVQRLRNKSGSASGEA